MYDQRCNDPLLCVKDGHCAIINEGCICDDCKDLPECKVWLDAGIDGGGDEGDGGVDGGGDAGDGGVEGGGTGGAGTGGAGTAGGADGGA